MRQSVYILIFIFLSITFYAQKIKTPATNLQSFVRFTENKHQWDKSILYRAQLDGGALFVEKSGQLTYNLYDKDSYRARHLGRNINDKLKYHAYTVSFDGANEYPKISSSKKSDDYVNYFVGKNKNKWVSKVYSYNALLFENLYDNIDATYVGGKQSLKYTFIVKPGGNSDNIKISYKGIDHIRLKNNELHVSTSLNESIEQAPFVYQLINNDTVIVPCHYKLQNNIVSFELLNDYNHSIDLMIDPLLVFSASSGSTADNFGMTATFDSRGSL